MQWQRWLRIALGVFFVGLVLVVVFTMRARTPVPAAPSVSRVDPNAAVELPQGADITWTQKGREAFTLRFTRGLSYPDGRYTFTGPHVTIPDRNNRTVEIDAQSAELFAPTGQPRRGTFRGNVVLRSSDGLTLKTDEASYSEADNILRIPRAFTFARQRMSGSGRGGIYDQNADVLVINSDARVRAEPDEGNPNPMDIASGTATMDRRLHLVRFERHATVVNGTQTTEAESLLAHLAEDNETLTRIELRGGSRVSDPSAAPGALRSMQAQDINLVYAPDGRTLQLAELRVGSVMEVAGSATPRRLAAETIDASVGPDGRTLQQLKADQRVQLDIPAEPDTPARRIRSNTLQGTGGPEGLRNATFTGAVEFYESQPARGKTAAIERTARADRLDATLAPGFGAPEFAVFRGRATFADGPTSGEAGVVTYAPGKNLMTLETPAGVAGATPRIADERVTISARWIEMTLDPRKLTAKGEVKSVLKETASRTKDTGLNSSKTKDAHRRPAMLTGNEPVNVTAAALQYDATTSKGVYTGGARLWQGETTIQGETLIIDDTAGNLTATKQVRTRMMLEQVNEKTKKTESVESIGTAEDFVYEDEERRATYTTKAHLTGPQGDLTAKKIVLFLNDDGRTLNRAEAYDDVVARLEGGQQAFGARLTYYAADERYVMTGTPVKVLEIVEGGCRETLGVSLTFVRSTDTISVVGTEGNRSRTMPGRCVESR